MLRIALITFIVAPLLMIGCDSSAPSARADEGQLTVVCTTTMITDLARVIAGPDAQVIGIMKTGEDPHVYEMRPRDTQNIAAADLVLMNGLHLEAQIDHVVENHASGHVVRLAEDARIKPRGSDQYQGAPDPHCWFNVEYFKVYAERARDALIEVDPSHAEAYRQRTDTYLAELTALHDWAKQQIAAVPKTQRVMITSHDAFGYFGETYDIEVHAVIGMSTEQIPTGRDKIRLQQLVTDRGAKAVFIETSVSQALNDMVRQIAEATGVRVGGTLYSDSLGEPDSDVGTYLGMFRHNVHTVVEALK